MRPVRRGSLVCHYGDSIFLSLGVSRAGRIDQDAFARSSSSLEFRYIPDIGSTQHRWS